MIISIAGQKGGAGKSTIAICLATEARKRSRSVLLVDADPQGTTSTWAAVASEQGQPAPRVVQMGATMHQGGQLAKAAEGFDFVFIDGPPRHSEVQRSMLMVSDRVLLPCGPSASDAWALGASLELITEARKIRRELAAMIVINRIKTGTALGKGARKALADAGLPIAKTELCDRVAYQEALAAGKGVTTYAPTDKATIEIQALYNEISRR